MTADELKAAGLDARSAQAVAEYFKAGQNAEEND